MDVQDLNNIANDIMVNRLEKQSAQKRLEEFLENNKEYQSLVSKIERLKDEGFLLNEGLKEHMKEAQLKSWKTEQANFARVVRKSASPNPEYKKQVEKRIKDGEEIEGWELKETEYISVKVNKS